MFDNEKDKSAEEAIKRFPKKMREYMVAVPRLPQTDFCWRYTGPFPSPDDLQGDCFIFSGKYFRMDNDCLDAMPLPTIPLDSEEKRSMTSHIRLYRWASIIGVIVLIVMTVCLALPSIAISSKSNIMLAKGAGKAYAVIFLIIFCSESLIILLLARNVLGVTPRLKFCRKNNTVYAMDEKGTVVHAPWGKIRWIIGAFYNEDNGYCYTLFMTDGELSSFELPVITSCVAFDGEETPMIRFIVSYHDFLSHYMAFGVEHLAGFHRKTDIPISFWSNPGPLGVVISSPAQYPDFQPEWESRADVVLRWLWHYLIFQFLAADQIHSRQNFRKFPYEIERL